MRGLKTIKQIADEIGVSKQAVYKKIKQEPLSTNLQDMLSTVDNKLTVSIDGENAIKQAFQSQLLSTKFTHIVNQAVNTVDAVDSLVDSDTPDKSRLDNPCLSTKFTGSVNQVDAPVNLVDNQNSKLIELLQENITVLQEQLRIKDTQLESKDRQIDELATAVRLHAEGVSADRKNELAETLIDNKKILVDGEIQKNKWWQLWRRS